MLDPSCLFENAVQDNFAFLEKRYGLSRSVIRSTPQAVIIRYENEFIYVNLMFGPPAYEPEMSFGRLQVDDCDNGFSFEPGDLILLESCKNWHANNISDNTILNEVSWLASLLNNCGSSCLLGDESVFERMKERRENLIETWKNEENSKRVYQNIELAWKNKDYKAVVEGYSKYGRIQSKVDIKRLEIALQKINEL